MLTTNERRLTESLDDSARVLDVGGWARPLARADAVIDLMPYETRGRYATEAAGEERFGPESWFQHDICSREPWPFADASFDFAVCSHTLEDLRDPVWVCGELQRVARAGVIEVPSRLEEQSYGFEGPWVGWSHHRWVIDIGPGSICFVFKPHMLHRRPAAHFPFGFHSQLTEEERAQSLWWEGAFRCAERFFYDPKEHDRFFEDFVATNSVDRAVPARWRGIVALLGDRARGVLSRRRRRAGS